jgi:hypothetical protein
LLAPSAAELDNVAPSPTIALEGLCSRSAGSNDYY